MAARLAVGQVTAEPAALLDPECMQGASITGLNDGLDLLAAASAGKLLILLAQLAAGTEEAALDHRLRHPEALADLVVGAALELAHHQQLVMAVRQSTESAAEVIELLLAFDRGRGRRHQRQTPAVVGRELIVVLHRHLTGARAAPELVDARVLGNGEDPRFERDRLIAGA